MIQTVLMLALTLDLSGTWNLRESNDLTSSPIAIPGDVHTALLAAGRIPDPFVGQNENQVQWVAEKTWIVSRTFNVPESVFAAPEVVLRLEDVDLFCDVYLNDTLVGSTDDRYLRYDFNVRKALKAGANELRCVFRNTLDELEKIVDRVGSNYPTGGGRVPYMTLLRKPPCHGGWDWGLCQMTVGLLGKVELLASASPRLDYLYCDQNFSPDLTHCQLVIHADFSDGSTETKTIEIDNPPLWWPNGLGPQQFYEYEFRGEKRRIGLRKLEVVRTPDRDADGNAALGLKFRVNNVDVFAKGANWIPCEAFANRMTRARYRDLLGSAARANMNMIRVWGGGQYERDEFYEACDELGLLLWHDHPFACGIYPGHEAFLGKVRAELHHQLRRLRDHASIAMWCGDNECVGSLNWYPEATTDPSAARANFMRRVDLQTEMTARDDPARILWPSSPCAGPGSLETNWKNSARGDAHNWSVWGGLTPFTQYYVGNPRFVSEFGLQSFPSPETCERFVPREKIDFDAPDFAYHQKSAGGNKAIIERIGTLFDPPVTTREAIYLSQVQQALGIKTAVEYYRAMRPWCMGTLYWQLDDLWPVASWSSIEYGGKWKLLQYAAKRFYAPLLVVAYPANGKAESADVEIVALNDTRERVKGPVVVRMLTSSGEELKRVEWPVDLPAGETRRVGSLPVTPRAFLVLEFAGSRNDYFFGACKDLGLRAAHVTATPFEKDGAWCVRLETDAPAFAVTPDAAHIRGEFSDADLTLLPGEPQTVVFRPREGETATFGAFAASLSVAHLKSFPREVASPDTPFRGLTPTSSPTLRLTATPQRPAGCPYALAANEDELILIFDRTEKPSKPATRPGRISLIASAGALYCTFYADADRRVRGKWSCEFASDRVTARIRWKDLGVQPPRKAGDFILDRTWGVVLAE